MDANKMEVIAKGGFGELTYFLDINYPDAEPVCLDTKNWTRADMDAWKASPLPYPLNVYNQAHIVAKRKDAA